MLNLHKIMISCTLVLALLMVGCGKKSNKNDNKKVALNENSLTQKMAEADIPVVDNEIEDFFEDSSEFAFADENLDTTKVAQSEIDNSLLNENTEDENAFVAWNEEEVQNLNFKTVQFDLNENRIREDQKHALTEDVQAAKLAVAEGKTVVVQGHACQMGSPSYNIPLSERRADVIKKEMVKSGVPEEKVKTVGYGQEMPIVWSEKTDKQELIKELAPNRRAEITVS
ncbi:OmpA family protein [Candidatus Dependentiae bacterium]|nr:OmpA family protein [Candidatus Dependentiae bacterium]MBU4386846.1 OmpA family protein [Candidatus Dependentiae bacterium]MCG2756316.1 OmpA family protein [Candidatus Dependentiae bacterium]